MVMKSKSFFRVVALFDKAVEKTFKSESKMNLFVCKCFDKQNFRSYAIFMNVEGKELKVDSFVTAFGRDFPL